MLLKFAAIVPAMAALLGGPASADVITDWNDKAVAFVTARSMVPPQAERVIASVHLAMFDAVNSIERRYAPYRTQLSAAKDTSKDAAAAAAAAGVLTAMDPKAAEELALTAYLERVPAGTAKDDGLRLGAAVAAGLIAERAQDGADAPDAYRPKAKAGVYVPTPITASSMWPKVRPFAMTSPTQFRPDPPVSLASEDWTRDYNEIKALGARNSTRRTAQQTEDARFWLMTGPAAYYPLVRQLATLKKMDVVDSARLLALTAAAAADSFIAVFDAKYHYDFWRPITAIRNGDIDDNPGTEVEATWQPIDNTPMHPEYPCAHCISSAAVASVVEAVLGSADIPEVSLTSRTLPGVTHRWTNVWAYADEILAARIYAGFHYRFSGRVGQDMGRQIGQHVSKTILQPARVAEAQ
jgi:hypothetical protein